MQEKKDAFKNACSPSPTGFTEIPYDFFCFFSSALFCSDDIE